MLTLCVCCRVHQCQFLLLQQLSHEEGPPSLPGCQRTAGATPADAASSTRTHKHTFKCLTSRIATVCYCYYVPCRVHNGQSLSLQQQSCEDPPKDLLMGLFGTTAFYDHVTSTQVWTCRGGCGGGGGGAGPGGAVGGGGRGQAVQR